MLPVQTTLSLAGTEVCVFHPSNKKKNGEGSLLLVFVVWHHNRDQHQGLEEPQGTPINWQVATGTAKGSQMGTAVLAATTQDCHQVAMGGELLLQNMRNWEGVGRMAFKETMPFQELLH